MQCADCGERLPDGARFCPACGRRVEPERIEPRLDLDKVRATEPEHRTAGGDARKEPTVKRPTSPSAGPAKGKSAPRDLRKIWPLGMVALGALLATAAYWSAAHDDAVAKAAAAQRVANATGPLPTTQEVAPGDAAFSTRQALQGLYGGYDPHLDGTFWKVTGAPHVWGEWNGRRVFVKPLVSRSDESGTRHVIVTNSVEVRDGLVVKEGTACRDCKSLLGAALFERRGGEWVLVTEQRFLRVAGAWGAPPAVAIDFPHKGGVEVRFDNAALEGGRKRTTQAVILHAGKPARAPQPRGPDTAETSIAAR